MRWLLPILILASGLLLIIAALTGVNHRAVSLGNAALMTVTALYAVHTWIAYRRRSKDMHVQLDRFLTHRVRGRSAKIIPLRRRPRPTGIDDLPKP